MSGTPAAHAPFTPAPQYVNTSAGQIAPRLPNYNAVFQDKHQLLRDLTPMNATDMHESDQFFRWRHGTLQSVDNMVANIFALMDQYNQTSNTYFFFTSDNVRRVSRE